MQWQTPARWGVAVFGVLFAIGVYFKMGERRATPAMTPVERQDPTATSETVGGELTRLIGLSKEFAVSFENSLSYPDGISKHRNVRIESQKRDGRDFVLTAKDAIAVNEKDFTLQNAVNLKASDGFELQTEQATFAETDHVVRAPGAVTFKRGGMNGSGVGMTYDQQTEILTLASESKISMADEEGATTMAFESGASMLDRLQNLLTLDGGVHVVRIQQEFDADRGVARMTENEEQVQFVELRGNARVSGGGALDAMSARDIDLDYTDDGQTLERVVLAGDAAVAVKGTEGSPGREFFGGRIELILAADGTVTKVSAQEGVRLVLPGAKDVLPRTITASALDAYGEPGKGFTRIAFDDKVDYSEGAGSTARRAQSRALNLLLNGDAVGEATFTGRAQFRDGRLEAQAGEARYAPDRGTLHLTGSEAGRDPRVADDQIEISAAMIDVAIETRKMTAAGNVKTTTKPSPKGQPAGKGETKVPGLLKADAPVNVTAASLDYAGPSGRVIYSGAVGGRGVAPRPVSLTQGETNIRAARLEIDQEAGNLTATGSARVVLVTDKGESSDSSADVIVYTDARREIDYTTKAPAQSRMRGVQGDLQANAITIALEKEGSGLARIDAAGRTSIVVGRRTVTSASLEYVSAKGGSYVMHGGTGRPVTVTDRTEATCRQMEGTKLTMAQSTDNMTIADGKTGTCPAASPAPSPAR